MSVPDIQHVTKSFLDGQVTAEFWPFLTVRRDAVAAAAYNKVDENGVNDGVYTYRIMRFMAYTMNMQFKWNKNASPYVKALEKWWNMVQEGKSDLETYMFGTEYVPAEVWDDFHDAYREALNINKPAREEETLEEEEENTDPNS